MTQGLELRGAVLGKGYRLGRRLDDSDDPVYEATHERIPGRFLIRLFPPESLSQPESSSRIQRGARVASLLRDAHAVQVLDCNASGEVPAFVVMERPNGQSLTDLMTHSGMLPLGRVVDLVDSIAAALAAGHQIGLVHGDLRPAHVILPISGQPSAKLSGFGWAKELRAAARIPAPSGYLAPEQNFGKVLTLDERVDQFGLAALAYEMIAACLPFSEESADLAGIVATPRIPPAIADLVPGIPKALDEVLRRGLAFAPSERWSGVTELASKLRIAAAVGDKSTETTQIISVPAPIAPPAGAALPVKPSSDITEELDLGTLSPVHTDDDIEIEGSGADETDDANDDAKLVLGPTSGPTVTDDAKTQIRRSPFFGKDEEVNADDDADDVVDSVDDIDDVEDELPIEDSVVEPPRRGLPIGRPAKIPSPSVNGAPKSALRLAPSGPTDPDAVADGGSLGDKMSTIWAAVQERRAWIFPATTGVLLLVIVGAMVLMSRDTDDLATTGGTDSPAITAGQTATQGATQGAPPPAATQAPVPPPAAPVLPVAAPPVAARPVAAPAVPPARTASGRSAMPSGQPTAAAVGPQVPAVAPSASMTGGQPGAPARAAAARPVARRPPTPTAPTATVASTPDPPPATRPSLGGGPEACSIHITSRPWAQVWIDGKNTGRKTPIDNLKVACGVRKLELKRPDKDIEQMEMLKVVPGQPHNGDYELQ